MIADTRRERIKAALLLRFEESLQDIVGREIEDTRDQREELLAEQIEERLRDRFDEALPEALDVAVETEEELAT